MTTIVFSGNEREAFDAVSGTVTEDTTSGRFNATYCRSCLTISGSGGANSIVTPPLGAQTTAYTRFDLWNSNSSAGRIYARFYNNAGTEVFRLNSAGSGVLQMQYWNGSSFTNIGSTYTLSNATLVTVEIKIVCGGSGSAELLINSASIGSGSASMTSVTDINKVMFCDTSGVSTTTSFSRLTVSTVSMSTWQQFIAPATGVGADTDGAGTYTDINEQTTSDATFASLTTAGQHKSFKSAARSLGTGSVKGVTVTARALKGATGPSKFKFYLTISGTRYYSSDISLTTSMAPYQYTWETNPATGAVWTTTAAGDANLEWGWEAVT